MEVPQEVIDALAEFDSREGSFRVNEVRTAISRRIEGNKVPEKQRRGYWAERAAFFFHSHAAPGGGPWKTYFQPAMTFAKDDGSPVYSPDIAEADDETIAYWSARAKKVKHPTLAARYADLVWDFCKLVTKSAPGVEFAHLAIDSYIASLKMDDGEAWGDNRRNVDRVLGLAMSIKNSVRVVAAVEAVIDYAERTSEDDKVGTYIYLFDLLLPVKKGPPLSAEQERTIVARFEERFAKMAEPGGALDGNPHSIQDIGLRLAGYYERKERHEDRLRALTEIAKAFERRAKMGDAMTGMLFLNDAHRFYVLAGHREEAERILREAQALSPEVAKNMPRHTVEIEIPNEDRQKFLDSLLSDGIKEGLLRWAIDFLPRQHAVKKQMQDLAEQYPLQAIFAPALLGDEGVKAKVDDTTGDPDGPMIFETSKYMSLMTVWMSWGLDHLIENGLTSEMCVDVIAESPVFQEDRLPLIQRGWEAHMVGDYVQSIHVLVPQIERALVCLVYLLGGAATKPHRSGRGVVQSKSLNDALADEETRRVLGPDLTIYLSAALSHPKGQNVRNEVCHGLWGPEAFTKQASERVLHATTALSLLRAKPRTDDNVVDGSAPTGQADDADG